MTAKQLYRLFLQSDFWKELSSLKKSLVGECERCGSVNRLQSHHIRYPDNWYDTTLEDLEVLCRLCHWEEHHIGVVFYPFIVYRDDPIFSATVHRCDCLSHMVISGRGLRPRDEEFLRRALKRFPATKKDGCVKFHVEQAWKSQAEFLKGHFTT